MPQLYVHASGPLPGPASLLPSRRANKACSNCRHDKIRCDDARPCLGCRRRGMSAEDCIDGCEPCRRARLRCDGGAPCTRCLARGLPCVSEPPVTADFQRHPGAFKPIIPSAPEQSQRKAKLPCKACRKDNHKCEDHRPCGRCVLRGTACERVGRGPKMISVRCEGCRATNKRCEDARPCQFCMVRGCDCIDPPRKGRGQGTRVKAACINCRNEKIRCDGSRPCQACTKKGINCHDRLPSDWPSPNASERPTTSRSTSSNSSSTSDSYRDASLSPLAFSVQVPPDLPSASSGATASRQSSSESHWLREAREFTTSPSRWAPLHRSGSDPHTEVLPPLAAVLGWAVGGQR